MVIASEEGFGKTKIAFSVFAFSLMLTLVFLSLRRANSVNPPAMKE